MTSPNVPPQIKQAALMLLTCLALAIVLILSAMSSGCNTVHAIGADLQALSSPYVNPEKRYPQ